MEKDLIKENCRNYQKNLICHRIVFYDFVDDKKLTSLYKEAFCVIFMPYNEPFGIVALESLAAGTPVIGLKNGEGYSEIIDDGKNGFLTGFDPHVIADKIRFMQNDEEKYKKMVKDCKKSAENYTWDKTADAAFKVLRIICIMID